MAVVIVAVLPEIVKLPPDILPVAVISPLTFTPSSMVTKLESSLEMLLITRLTASRLPAMMFPEADINPVTYAPVDANTTTFDVPFTLVVMLPFALTTVTFDVPLAIAGAVPTL